MNRQKGGFEIIFLGVFKKSVGFKGKGENGPREKKKDKDCMYHRSSQ